MKVSAETRLVFRCARDDHDDVVALARDVRSWDAVATLAANEGALPALWRALQSHREAVPAEVAEYLKRSVMVSDFRMQLLALRAQETVRALEAREVPVLLLKGAAIGALADASFRSRPMGDVDMLVRPGDVERATEAVLAAGWQLTTDEVVLRLLQDRHHLPHFVRADLPGNRLELHTLALPPEHPFALERDWIWANANPAPEPFAGALLPSPVIGVLHASIHFAWQHRLKFGAWRTARSLAVLTQQPEFSWDALVAMALPARAGTSVYWTLRTSSALGALDVPHEVLARLAPPNPEWVNAVLERHFVSEIATHEGPASPSVRLSRLLWEAALRPKRSGHPPSDPIDESQDWDVAYGRKREEGMVARTLRHLKDYRRWTGFIAHVLGAR